MTSPNASIRSADFKIVLHVKLLTTQLTLTQLVRCFRKTVLLTLYSGTDCSTRTTQSSVQKFRVEYQRTHLLCQEHPSSQGRFCYQQCEWDSEPTDRNPTDYKIKSITPVPISRRDRPQPLRVMSIGIAEKDKNCFIIN